MSTQFQKFSDENLNTIHTEQQILNRRANMLENNYPVPVHPDDTLKKEPKPYFKQKTIDMSTAFNNPISPVNQVAPSDY